MNSQTTINPICKQQKVILNVASRKYDFFMELLGNFDFVEVTKEEVDGDTREEIIAKLKDASIDLKQIKAGKLKGRPARELLNEL